MAGLKITVQPASEPVSLTEAKNFLRVVSTDDDLLISSLISAARESVESFCNRSFVERTYEMTLDAFPYFVDTAMSLNAYPPSFYAQPIYSTQWNYSQMIKLYAPPAIAVTGIVYTKPDNTTGTLVQDTDFVLDTVNEPARIFPKPGAMWPPVLYAPNAVVITYTAGFTDPANIPARVKAAILIMLAGLYENREPVVAGSVMELPQHLQSLLYSLRVFDFAPTRG